jgi:tetratricopeptide (TPR) repeat protein
LNSSRNRPEQAAAYFAQALSLVPGDLKLRAKLAEALLKHKDLNRAEAELKKLLSIAPANVEALIAHAQLCIELADGGDADRYGPAEEELDTAIRLGSKLMTGSKRLSGRALADVYYLRGYVRVKRYESDAKFVWTLARAERDFADCSKLDPTNYKARSAQQKVAKKVWGTARGRLQEWIGSLALCIPAAMVFVLAQWDFFFPKHALFGMHLADSSQLKAPGYYVLATFGSLLFMVAGLSLSKLLKLKVGAIELEKGSVEQINVPVNLNISRLEDRAPPSAAIGMTPPIGGQGRLS